ncbi:hypothetical protein E2C01_027620 [Portunus trituberculatus]|uniref:Uncharacterized protein n=1 Tax=Portunus trituberculatus TaxID=210409 RepID=A0A5B7ELT1_PORTR|nr:hypothetical protein [Portunus trituberculatus]
MKGSPLSWVRDEPHTMPHCFGHPGTRLEWGIKADHTVSIHSLLRTEVAFTLTGSHNPSHHKAT